MENNDCPADITTVRKLCIDPSKFENRIGTGMHKTKSMLFIKTILFFNNENGMIIKKIRNSHNRLLYLTIAFVDANIIIIY